MLLNYALLTKMQDDAYISGGGPLIVGAIRLIEKGVSALIRKLSESSKSGHVSNIEVSFLVNDYSMNAPATPTHISVL
jgi:hypothetical protein